MKNRIQSSSNKDNLIRTALASPFNITKHLIFNIRVPDLKLEYILLLLDVPTFMYAKSICQMYSCKALYISIARSCLSDLHHSHFAALQTLPVQGRLSNPSAVCSKQEAKPGYLHPNFHPHLSEMGFRASLIDHKWLSYCRKDDCVALQKCKVLSIYFHGRMRICCKVIEGLHDIWVGASSVPE